MERQILSNAGWRFIRHWWSENRITIGLVHEAEPRILSIRLRLRLAVVDLGGSPLLCSLDWQRRSLERSRVTTRDRNAVDDCMHALERVEVKVSSWRGPKELLCSARWLALYNDHSCGLASWCAMFHSQIASRGRPESAKYVKYSEVCTFDHTRYRPGVPDTKALGRRKLILTRHRRRV